jgi:energy-coupling factor transporter ATP-binding protein EcfA2
VSPAFRGFVVVSGPPASGKSTLAPALAGALDLPLLAKDVIKDALLDVLGAPDLPRSRELGTAAVHVLLAVARTAGCGVLESVWYGYVRGPLAALPGPKVEVFCRCTPELLHARFTTRSASRGAGYLDRDRDAAELWNSEVSAPVAGGWPVLEVDTTASVDVPALARRVTTATG